MKSRQVSSLVDQTNFFVGGTEETLTTHKSKRRIVWKAGSALGRSLLLLKTCDSLCDWVMDKRPSESIEVNQESSPKNLKNS